MTGGPATDLLLLDTHVWMWAFHGEGHRLAPTLPALVVEARREDRIRLSAVSVFEASHAIVRGRVPIRGTLDEWLDAAITAFGGRVRTLDRDIAVESVRLPGQPHGDPMDRFLIATARALGARLVTADDRILEYGSGGHVKVLDARPGR